MLVFAQTVTYIILLLLGHELCVLLVVVLHPVILICGAGGSGLNPSIGALVEERINGRKSSPAAPVKSAG